MSSETEKEILEWRRRDDPAKLVERLRRHCRTKGRLVAAPPEIPRDWRPVAERLPTVGGSGEYSRSNRWGIFRK
jgi:hypothetical protein